MEYDMQFMTSLFGGSAGTLLNAAFALGIVLVLIVIGLWLLKLFTSASQRLGRLNEKRLHVLETATVDGKRKVMIIRRDNVEHVIMTGGPQDLVIETGIAVPEPQPMRRPAARPAAAAKSTETADIATPITPDRPVTRDTVDRLRDLTRPAPLKPRVALRHTALLRPVGPGEKPVIPMGPELAVDNSAGPSADSARGASSGETGGQVSLGGRNRFFRSVARDRS
jgi:flagellar biogenesis protein FliO